MTNLLHFAAYDVPGPTIRQLALIGIPAQAFRISRVGGQVRVRRNDPEVDVKNAVSPCFPLIDVHQYFIWNIQSTIFLVGITRMQVVLCCGLLFPLKPINSQTSPIAW